MKNKLTLIACIMLCNIIFSQPPIKPDVATMVGLGRVPQKTESNIMIDQIFKILYYKVQEDDRLKIGYMDNNGKIITPPIYNYGTDFYGDYANIIKDSIYGFIDKQGNETLFEKYDKTFFYYCNTGIASKNGQYTLINREGKPLIKFSDKAIKIFGFNTFSTKENNNKTLYNSDGKIIFKNKKNLKISSHYMFSNSTLAYEKIIEGKTKTGLIDLEGNILVKPVYDDIIYYISKYNLYVVKNNNKWGFINKYGKKIIPVNYDKIRSIDENLIVAKKGDKWGFINLENETVIPFIYDDAYGFSSGIAFVKKGEYYGCIDKKNKVKIDFKLESNKTLFFGKKLAVLKQGGKYGFIDKKGRNRIPAIYDKTFPFYNNKAYVELNGKYGFINRKGKEEIPIKYNQLWFESEGMIKYAK